jgi:hypothetical protein
MAAKRNGSKAGSRQRDRLLARPRPSFPFPIRVADPAEARQQLQQVEQETRQAVLRHDKGTPEYEAAKQRLVDAKAEVDACYETVILTAMPPAAYEQLKAEHPPTAGQVTQAGQDGDPPPDANVDTFVPAVLAAGCDNGMTAVDWAAFLAERCSDGERQELRVCALAINERPRFAEPLVLPKGWTPTLS